MNRVDELRERYGAPSERAATKVKDFITDEIKEFIQKAPFAVLASSNAQGDCDASPRGGHPGFIKVIDERTLLIPDIKGNRLFQSYGNIETNPKVGLLFMIPGDNRTVRVNGSVRFVEKEEMLQTIAGPEVFHPDEGAIVLQGLLLTVNEAYRHCPRAFQFSNLWGVKPEKTDRPQTD